MPAIEVSGLQKTFGGGLGKPGKHALRGVDLRVERGAAFGLIGPNGAGKTTLLKAILGVTHPSAGRIAVFGAPPEDIRVRRRIGYLPERLHLPGSWTPRQFLASIGRLKRLAADPGERESLLSRVALADVADGRIGGFSKGMRQRLGLAGALLGKPDLLILDEPTDGIDPKGRIEVRGILEEERLRGATIFLNSHLLAETERICDQVGFLVDGRLVEQGGMLDLCASDKVWMARFASSGAQETQAPYADSGALEALGFQPQVEVGCYRVEAASLSELNGLLERARDEGALLSELRPAMRDLESVLLDVMGGHALEVER